MGTKINETFEQNRREISESKKTRMGKEITNRFGRDGQRNDSSTIIPIPYGFVDKNLFIAIKNYIAGIYRQIKAGEIFYSPKCKHLK